MEAQTGPVSVRDCGCLDRPLVVCPPRERKPRNQQANPSGGGEDSNVDPSEQDQPEIPLFHAGMEAPEGEAIVESRAPKPVPAPPAMDETDDTIG